MNLYRINEAEFVLPYQSQDQSVNIFAIANLEAVMAPKSQVPPEFSFVVSRENVGIDEFAQGFASKGLQVLSQKLPGYRLILRGETIVDGVGVVTAEYNWKSDRQVMRQRQAYIICPLPSNSATGKSSRTGLIITATTLESIQEKYAFIFEQILYSFSFRRS